MSKNRDLGTNFSRGLHFPTIEDKIYEAMPNISDPKLLEVMRELTYIFMDPNRAFQGIKIINESEVIQKVIKKVLQGKRYKYTD